MNDARRNHQQANPDPHPARAGIAKLSGGLVRELVDYNPDTGLFFWRPRDRRHFKSDGHHVGWNKRFAGKPAFVTDTGNGYYCGFILDDKVKAHRVAWAHYYGSWPGPDIDHINRDGRDNRIANLRLASDAENMRNRASSGAVPYIGVWKQGGKFSAQVAANKKVVWRGTFDTAIEAAKARDVAAAKAHGRFANLNFGMSEVS